MALLLALARNIPQAHSACLQGRWERSKWEGVELADKTLAVIGLGRIGKLVAQRAMAFGMRIIAHDPFVAPERAQAMNIDLVSLDEVAAQADFLTLRVAKTPETIGLIGEDFLAKARPELRVINVSRGGIVDEDALYHAIKEGRIAGAALDVFAKEPTTESPLFELDDVVVAPHLGASTREAQDKAGDTIAEQVGLALAGEFVPFAVNVAAAEASETVRPFLGVAEQLGALFAGLSAGDVPDTVDIEYQGELAGYDTRILTLSVLKGLFGAVSDDPVSYVNAPQLAADRGTQVNDSSSSSTVDWVNLICISGGGHQIAGTLVGLRAEPRLVQIEGHTVDVPPSANLLVIHNDDRPGVIGRAGTILGDAGVNIADMDVGRSSGGSGALMVIATTEPVPAEVAEALRGADGIVSVSVISR
ncbi:MAG: NAD(P)-dependent oxidoreductase [Acidimicrobiales bacterium]